MASPAAAPAAAPDNVLSMAQDTSRRAETPPDETRKLRESLEQEKRRVLALTEELRQSKLQNVVCQKQVEQEEEYITMQLIKRLEQLKREKAILATTVEQEEEFLTNTLQKRLEKLTKEKVDLENRLEAEQEHITNSLNKQVEKLAQERNKLLRERSELQQAVGNLAASVDKLNRDKVALEAQLEAEEECIVNKLQRQLDGVLLNYRLLEQRLEARGIRVKELGVAPMEPDAFMMYGHSPGVSRRNSGLGLRRERPTSASSQSQASQSGGSPRSSSGYPSSPGAPAPPRLCV